MIPQVQRMELVKIVIYLGQISPIVTRVIHILISITIKMHCIAIGAKMVINKMNMIKANVFLQMVSTVINSF